ncbi:MAG: hypothetical protein HY521_15040 [Proteobacteria bacterium]|nr:hypothetical protein [Pseudomonadota bacterium]
MTYECIKTYTFHHNHRGEIIDKDADELEALTKLYSFNDDEPRVVLMTDRQIADLPSSDKTQDALVREAKVLAFEKGWRFGARSRPCSATRSRSGPPRTAGSLRQSSGAPTSG